MNCTTLLTQSHPRLSLRKFARLGCLALVAALLPLWTGCVSTQQTESWLSQSGFKAYAADNAKRQQALNSLPADKVSQVTRDGKIYYVFPDKKRQTLFVGNAANFAAYKNLVAAKIAETQAQSTLDLNNPGFVASENFTDGWPDGWFIP
jgi:hypothetical protein